MIAASAPAITTLIQCGSVALQWGLLYIDDRMSVRRISNVTHGVSSAGHPGGTCSRPHGLSGVLLIRARHQFSPKGNAVALVLAILTTSLGVTLALVFSFTAINFGVEAVGTDEFGTVEVRTQ